MARYLYNALLLLISPLIFIGYLWRVFVSRKSNLSWKENLGALPVMADRSSGRKLVWVHAASVGEVMASLPVQEELRRLLPNASILLTTITQTGNAVSRKSAKYADAIAFFPLDFTGSVEKALERVKPDVVVLLEGEFWPNFLDALERRKTPVVLVNGKVSDRSLRRSRKWRWLMTWALSSIDACCMQTRTDADRIVLLGANPSVVTVEGNTKFDQDGGRLAPEAAAELKMNLGISQSAPVFVAGSTNSGEDEPILDAFGKMRIRFPDLRLVIAPRQLERRDEIRSLAEMHGFKCASRSLGGSNPVEFDVLILDSYGELSSVYAIAEITFVGGTLTRKGGHSLIQPILQGKPVFFGPHTVKTRDIANLALESGVGIRVMDADQLAEEGLRLLSDPDLKRRIDEKCIQLVEANQGASLRCAQVIAGFLSRNTERTLSV